MNTLETYHNTPFLYINKPGFLLHLCKVITVIPDNMKMNLKQSILLILALMPGYISVQAQTASALEVVAELDIRPGNVAVNAEGRVFATVHPLANPTLQLIEITGKDSYVPFPNAAWQNATGTPDSKKLDTPLGIRIDKNNVLWIIDMGQRLGTTRLFGFDIATKKEVFRYDFPADIAPKGSFIQDLAVDEDNGWVYLADIANPGIVALNTETKEARRFADPTVQAEKVDMIIDGKLINFGGAPASVAVNPITLSADHNTLYYGAMNGTTWYKVPATLFREGATDYAISNAVKVHGPKPVSDGAMTDAAGNHYFTNIQHHGIDVLTAEGELKPVVRDARIDWADNVALDGKGWIYVTVNQLHKTPAFTGGADTGKAPYFIFRVKI
ncbi:MAG: L-dopachrome tautomerase-related protein [Bacteroidota bacterium]